MDTDGLCVPDFSVRKHLVVHEQSLAVLLYLMVLEGDRHDGGRLDKVENLLFFDF